jgi:hypothetical protein
MASGRDRRSPTARLSNGCHRSAKPSRQHRAGLQRGNIKKSCLFEGKMDSRYQLFLELCKPCGVASRRSRLINTRLRTRWETQPQGEASKRNIRLSTEGRKRCNTMSGRSDEEVSNTAPSRVKLTAQPPSVGAPTSIAEQLGIDGILLRFLVDSRHARAALGNSVTIVVSNARERGFRAKFARSRDGKFWGFLSFNPARWALPNDWSCLPLKSAMPAIESVWETASPLLMPIGSLDMAEVKRLDIARDFSNVASPAPYLMRRDVEGLSIGALNWSQYVSSTGGRSIRGWNGSGAVQLYDKHRESGGFAPEGTVRFEVQLRKWLTRYGIRVGVVSDLSPDVVEHIARLWWNSSAFGTPLVSQPDVYTEVLKHFGSSRNAAARANSTFGYYARARAGIDIKDVPPNSRRRYVAALRSVNLSNDAAPLRSSGTARRLDLDTGTEVLVHA